MSEGLSAKCTGSNKNCLQLALMEFPGKPSLSVDKAMQVWDIFYLPDVGEVKDSTKEGKASIEIKVGLKSSWAMFLARDEH